MPQNQNNIQFVPWRAYARIYQLLLSLAGFLTLPIKHKGLWHLAKYLGKQFHHNDVECTILLGKKSRFSFPLSDPYWSRLLAPAYVYEEEIRNFLWKARQIPYTFLDCGANFGYWSIIASSPEFGSHRCVAIEASPETFERLLANEKINQDRFKTYHAAISSSDGKIVTISSIADHASRSICLSENGVSVKTRSLDSIAREQPLAEALLVKLDVEGAEILAFEGARQIMQNPNTAFLYEDHGADISCAPTDWLLKNIPHMRIYFLENAKMSIITSVEQLQARKTKKSQGYNLLLTHPNSVWGKIL